MTGTLLFSMALSVVIVRLVLADIRRRGVLDHPTERSSHTEPTPRGGGLGLLIAFALAAAFMNRDRAFELPSLLAAAGVAIVAIIGWVDDHGGTPVRLRLVVHFAAGALIVPLAMRIPLGAVAPGALLLAGVALWWVFWTISSINVVNFIDGIDGLIASQALIYGGFVALLAAPGGGLRVVALALAGASAGFLVWNWSPARIFLGDVGSGALGVVFVALGAALVAEGAVGFVPAFAPLAPIFLDAALTLVKRARRGERLSVAHRTHLYQRLANGGWGHARVSVLFGALSLATAAGAWYAPAAGPLFLVPLLLGLGAVWALLERAAVPADPPMLP